MAYYESNVTWNSISSTLTQIGTVRDKEAKKIYPREKLLKIRKNK